MKLITFSFFLVLSGCADKYNYEYEKKVLPVLLEIKKTYQPQIVDGVQEPLQFPDLEEDKKTLMGIDANEDGIRDDIEIYVNRTYKTEPERWSIKETYRILKQELDGKKRNAIERNLINNNASFVSDCPMNLYDIGLLKIDKKKFYEKIFYLSLTLNTEKRKSLIISSIHDF